MIDDPTTTQHLKMRIPVFTALMSVSALGGQFPLYADPHYNPDYSKIYNVTNWNEDEFFDTIMSFENGEVTIKNDKPWFVAFDMPF